MAKVEFASESRQTINAMPAPSKSEFVQTAVCLPAP